MQLWTTEYGALWAVETVNGLPPPLPTPVELSFAEVGMANLDALATAMALSHPEPIRQRLQSNRRCFSLQANSQVVSYGWVTRGVECVGELERQLHLQDDEAYVWDCGTILSWRQRNCYSTLLSHIIYRLHDEGIPRIWIGASRQNQPSIRGFVKAGFSPVVDCTYGRFYRMTLLWIHQAPAPKYPLISAAYRILINDDERRFGRLAIGFKR